MEIVVSLDWSSDFSPNRILRLFDFQTNVMISKKLKYALKALIHIANDANGFAKTSDIAEKAKIPKKFLEQILLELKKGHIINSRQGNIGGFYFVKKTEEVSLAEVYRLIDGPIALVACASKGFYEPCVDCDEVTCSIRIALMEVRDETLAILEKKTIAQLAANALANVNDFSI
jgi:Rrf2 family protein